MDPQLFTSDRSVWETPRDLFEELDERYGPFDLDAAASADNAKCDQYLTLEDDALSCEWAGKRIFANPPYGKGNHVGKWMAAVAREMDRGLVDIIVVLIPARTDTVWFHDIVFPRASEVLFIRGRQMFELGGKPILGKNGRPQGAPFPSMVVVFDRNRKPAAEMVFPVQSSIPPSRIMFDIPPQPPLRPRFYSLEV